jgi:SNF family Na+-dependent transporter
MALTNLGMFDSTTDFKLSMIPAPRAESWRRDIEFWLVVLGTSVGYGCIWRFPYILYENGGGVF